VRGIEYEAPEVIIKGVNILYIVYFHLPRYLDHGNHKTKLSTVLQNCTTFPHYLNGDIRRYTGKNYAHGNSRKGFDDLINIYTNEYIECTSNPELSYFLKYKYSELRRKYGAIYGDMIRIPRLKT